MWITTQAPTAAPSAQPSLQPSTKPTTRAPTNKPVLVATASPAPRSSGGAVSVGCALTGLVPAVALLQAVGDSLRGARLNLPMAPRVSSFSQQLSFILQGDLRPVTNSSTLPRIICGVFIPPPLEHCARGSVIVFVTGADSTANRRQLKATTALNVT